MACDRQTSGDVYCSQTCRLAELESSSSASSSPTSPSHPSYYSKRYSTSSNGFYLPPAIDFSLYRSGTSQTRSATSSNRSSMYGSSRPNSGYFASAMSSRGHGRAPSSPKLTPSSSQASLTSLQSTESRHASTDAISRQARHELREYTNSFDQVRDLRRRMTTA